MSPTWFLSLIFFVSCLCFLTEGKVAHGKKKVEREKIGKQKIEKHTTSAEEAKKKANKVRQRSKWWLIETTNNEKGGEYGMDYQDNDIYIDNDDTEPGIDYQDDDNTERVCSSDKHGSVGLAIDTTS